jgi:hypothetical protein
MLSFLPFKVMISAKDEPDAPVSPAMDGLLRVHKRITDSSDGESGQPQRSAGNIGPTRLLVPASQAGSLIGKQGATIKSIQDSSKSAVRIVGKFLHFFLFYICWISSSFGYMICCLNCIRSYML